jgi:hypothetical protein
MSDLIAHDCPKDDYDEVLIRAGKLCPNGCGWIACDGDLEEFAVEEARAALGLWGPWLRLGDAAHETGIAFPTIAQAAREGRLPFLQIGRQKFVRASAVRARLSNQRGRPEGRGLHRSRKLVDERRQITLAILKEQGLIHPNDLIASIEDKMPSAYLESKDGKADCLNRDTAWLRDVLKVPICFNRKGNEWEYNP